MAATGVSTLVLTLPRPTIVAYYELYTGPHAFGRNPTAWTLSSFAPSVLAPSGDWVTIDERQDVVPPPNGR
eukprot:1870099-Pleurochrysis_carterae.AAC.1